MVVLKEKCNVCGIESEFNIADDAVLFREAKCGNCGASIRNSDVAGEIIRFISGNDSGLKDQTEKLENYTILNTCSTGYIHDALKTLENYTCSEYFSEIPSGEYSEGILCVDLCSMPFQNNTFDIVISEDVFEHIDNYEKALQEIFRVLKPGGCHIFTVPIHDGRSSESRQNKQIVYHGDPNPLSGDQGALVITDWGDDIDQVLEKYGYSVDIKRKHIFYSPEEVTNVDKTYDEYLAKKHRLETYQKYNSIVIWAEKDRTLYREKDKDQEGQTLSIEELQKQLSYCSRKIIDYNRAIRNKNEQIRNLNDDSEKRGLHILDLDQELADKNEIINQQANEINEKENEINEKTNEINEKINEINEKTNEIDKKTKEIDEKTKEINEKNNEISEKQKVIIKQSEHILKLDEEIAGLREYRILAERELNSNAYKMGLKLRKFIAKILPKGTIRRTFCGFVVKCLRHPKMMLRLCKPSRIVKAFKILRTEGKEGLRRHYRRAEEAEIALILPYADSNIQINTEETGISIDSYGELRFVSQDKPLVSIVIPVYNQFDFTYKCLESILKNSDAVSYEIIIADDNSDDLTNQMETRIHNVMRIRNKENLRFLLNCNNAAKYAHGRYILFLNNDTQVQQNWLQPLVDLMEKDETTGMVGSKLVYSDGWLQEAGGIVWKDASAWNFGNRKNPDDAEYNYVKEADFISGACIMLRRELWNDIGGFDERFVPAYYEDVDLAFEVRKRGYKVLYQPLSVVVHFEGISNGTDLSSGQKAYQTINREKFYSKWKEVLEYEHYANGENVYLAKDRGGRKKHILVVDHYVPHFDKDAGGRGTFMYLKLFQQMGMHVTFIGDNFFKHEPYTTILNQEKIEILYGAYYLENYQQWIKENGKYFEYVYLQRPHISVKYMDLVKEYTNAKIIYYDVDLCHVREMRQYELTGDEALLESAEKWKKIEFGLIEKADVVHVVGSYEEKYLKAIFPNKPIRNIPLYIFPENKSAVNKNFDHRKDILFVGGFGHPPNEDAVLWFSQKVFPKVLQKYPDLKWYIVGSKPPITVQNLANENIIVKGFVSDEELNGLYDRCRLDIVPLRYGAGVKGKVLEAVYNQIPMITTSIGAEGLSKEEDAFWIEDDAEAMTERIIEIYNDKNKLFEKSENCKKFIINHFTIKKAIDILHLDLEV